MKHVSFLVLSLIMSANAIAETYLFVGTSFPNILEEKQDGESYGLGYDIAEKIAHRLGHEIKVEMYPFKRALKMIELGDADGLIGPYKSADRELFMQYSKHAFYQDPMVFYARVNSSFTWNNNYDSLKGMHIGVTRGWSYGQRFDQNKPNLSLEPVGTVKANFQKLVTGRIDLLASHPRSAARVMEEMQIEDDIKMLLPPITINKGYFGFSRKKNLDDFIFRFDQEFEKMVESKEIIQLSKKYNLDYTNIHQ